MFPRLFQYSLVPDFFSNHSYSTVYKHYGNIIAVEACVLLFVNIFITRLVDFHGLISADLCAPDPECALIALQKTPFLLV